jgi:hypothetical protein
MTMSNATINFATMNQPGDNEQQRTLYNQTTKDPANKAKGPYNNRSDNNRGL